eukprot:TRINITY_DN36845_c0_g1_i1.p1 TRINITY_DN36845_c0_g1~~TRINITY_DN36845_c0_g1_i1.p1  ORF type:complete len:433 (+),score=95.49 TRINITY_DN36845_c0_g1_i1:45-1301(+)
MLPEAAVSPTRIVKPTAAAAGHNSYDQESAEREAQAMFDNYLDTRFRPIHGKGSTPESIPTGGSEQEPADQFTKMLEDSTLTIESLPLDEVKAIHAEEASAFLRSQEDKTADVMTQELKLLLNIEDSLEDTLRSVEEDRLTLELGLARLERTIPTQAAWIKEQKHKLLQLQTAFNDPGSIVPPDDGIKYDICSLENTVRTLSRNNSELEQEGLIKSLNACHAMEMLTTSLKFQKKWSLDSGNHASSMKLLADDTQHLALAAAREEESLLKQLHQITSLTADLKNRITLVYQRLNRSVPLENGTFVNENHAAVLKLALRDELSKGVTTLLDSLTSSFDYNILPDTGPVLAAPTPAAAVSPPLRTVALNVPSSAREKSRSSSRSSEDYQRIQMLQEQAQKQLQGVAATLRGLALNAGIES